MSEMTVHAWGFVRDGVWQPPDGFSATTETPMQAHERVTSNVTYFGGEITALRTTWGAGGWLGGTEFETPERDDGKAGHMWHVIAPSRDAWAAKP